MALEDPVDPGATASDGTPTDFPSIQGFEDGSTLQTFEDGSTLATATDGTISSSPAPDVATTTESPINEQPVADQSGAIPNLDPFLLYRHLLAWPAMCTQLQQLPARPRQVLHHPPALPAGG